MTRQDRLAARDGIKAGGTSSGTLSYVLFSVAGEIFAFERFARRAGETNGRSEENLLKG